MSNTNQPKNDPALGSFICFVERVALSTRLNYIKHTRLVCEHEYVTDYPPETSDGESVLDRLSWSLEEVSGNLSLCAALRLPPITNDSVQAVKESWYAKEVRRTVGGLLQTWDFVGRWFGRGVFLRRGKSTHGHRRSPG